MDFSYLAAFTAVLTGVALIAVLWVGFRVGALLRRNTDLPEVVAAVLEKKHLAMLKDLNDGLNSLADRVGNEPDRELGAAAQHRVAGSEADARCDAGAAAVADRGAVRHPREPGPAPGCAGGRAQRQARRAARRAAHPRDGAPGRAGARQPGADPERLASHRPAGRRFHRVAHPHHRHAPGADQRQGARAPRRGLQEHQRDLCQRHGAAGHHRRGAEEDRRPDHQRREPAGAAGRQALARRLRRGAARGAGAQPPAAQRLRVPVHAVQRQPCRLRAEAARADRHGRGGRQVPAGELSPHVRPGAVRGRSRAGRAPVPHRRAKARGRHRRASTSSPARPPTAR